MLRVVMNRIVGHAYLVTLRIARVAVDVEVGKAAAAPDSAAPSGRSSPPSNHFLEEWSW